MGSDRDRRRGRAGATGLERHRRATPEGASGALQPIRPHGGGRTSRREAESELSDREKRRKELEIQPLEPEAHDRYAEEWRGAQERFVDDPAGAVGTADRLIQQVMRERGYPVDDFEQRAADLSVDHPDVISNYRAAYGISIANERGKASTEDLRTSMVHYRALFTELLEERPVRAEQTT